MSKFRNGRWKWIRDELSRNIWFGRKEWQRQGIQATKKNGKYLGRNIELDKKLISQLQYLKETKNLSITEITKITGQARTTIHKVLKNELNYIPYNRLVKNVNQ